MVASTVAGVLANTMRLTTGRTRPRESPKMAQGWYGPFHEGQLTIGNSKYNSFPSGHTATAVGFAGVILIARPVVRLGGHARRDGHRALAHFARRPSPLGRYRGGDPGPCDRVDLLGLCRAPRRRDRRVGCGQISPEIVSSIASFLERLPERRGFFLGLVAFLLLIFATGNLPWHLDNYDQAKQAYVAFEISNAGAIWFQHTPQDRYASKPPLMGWISAALHAAGMPWDFAWRLPSFFCAVALLVLLAREGKTLLGQAGATLAVAAFGLNLLTPRLATLLRTDMMLSCFIFLVGWMIYRKLRAATPWTAGERWTVFAFMVAALFTKGPVIYAFLLPGLVAFALIERGRRGPRLERLVDVARAAGSLSRLAGCGVARQAILRRCDQPGVFLQIPGRRPR